MAVGARCCGASPAASASGGARGRRRALVGVGAGAVTLRLAPAELARAATAAAALAAARDALAASVPRKKAPAVLRVAFHDAGTYDVVVKDGGANGSVQFELDRPESFGLKRGLRPVLEARAALAGTAGANLSVADMIYLGGAYAVELTGGPRIDLRLGRVDAAAPDPEDRMPAETLKAGELKAVFARAGLTTQELVALSGAHTIGGKGFGEPLDFDNAYYRTLLDKPWADPKLSKDDREMAMMIGLPSDKSLPDDPECREWIELYARDQDAFFRDFAAAYAKLSGLGATFA